MGDGLLREGGDVGQLGRQLHVAPVQPGSEPSCRRYRSSQSGAVAARRGQPGNARDQLVDFRQIHTNKRRQGVYRSFPDPDTDRPAFLAPVRECAAVALMQ